MAPVHYVLIYELSADYLHRRSAYREEHLRLAWAAAKGGHLLVGGALSEPSGQALLVFNGESDEAARRFAAADPYVKNGLVTSWSVRVWNTVAGPWAANPVRV